MRIALDYQAFTMQTYGGISRYFARLAQEYLSAGDQVKIFAPLYVNAYLTALPSECIKGKRLDKFPHKTTRAFNLYNRLISRKAVDQWQPNIVHETYYSRHCSTSKNYPTVITVHDMIHELFRQDFSKWDKTAETKKIAIDRADHVICVSENTKKDLINLLDTPAYKISVVRHGFDKLESNDYSVHSQKIISKPFLLYVGSRVGYKNFTKFLKAVAASHQMKSDFDVFAFGGGKFNTTELALIANLGFSENQVKQISGDDTLLGHYYAKARTFVYPSLYEGFGIPPLEAMAHNCPVVSSNTSSMPEVIGKAGEYFNPTSTEEMQHAIESVVYSDSRIAELKALGIERLANFSWAKCAAETCAVYRTIM